MWYFCYRLDSVSHFCCIIVVSLIVNLVANGMTTDEIIGEYPAIEPEDIKEALQYASWLTREEFH